MKNYLIDVKTVEMLPHSFETMYKILSNVIAFSGDLYCIDYHGVEHGVFMGYEDGIYHIKIIINNFNWDYDIIELIEDLSNNFARYKIFNIASDVKEVDAPTPIPENYIEHYYVNSYSIDEE